MRVQIKTGGPVKDKDIRALYLLHEAMKVSTTRMRRANLDFICDKVSCGDYEKARLSPTRNNHQRYQEKKKNLVFDRPTTKEDRDISIE